MIKPGEIQQKANAVGVRDQQIEKDYMLSWILYGISKHAQLSKAIVCKGGTVLKKVYFKDYRFSEDLDFTLLNADASTSSAQVSNEQIFAWFNEVFEFIQAEANIPFDIIDNNEHEDGGINFFISYIGPLGGQGNNKRVKVDISRSEQLVFEPVMNDVCIDYSDLEEPTPKARFRVPKTVLW
jgi:predicted nucleotidyltransferase component of viral defense system